MVLCLVCLFPCQLVLCWSRVAVLCLGSLVLPVCLLVLARSLYAFLSIVFLFLESWFLVLVFVLLFPDVFTRMPFYYWFTCSRVGVGGLSCCRRSLGSLICVLVYVIVPSPGPSVVYVCVL